MICIGRLVCTNYYYVINHYFIPSRIPMDPQPHAVIVQVFLMITSQQHLQLSAWVPAVARHIYCISSPISLVIFSVFDTEICKIFHQKRGSAYSRGFKIKKNCWIRWFYFFFGQHESVWRSLNIRVLAYSWDRLIGEEIRYFLKYWSLHILDISGNEKVQYTRALPRW